MRFRVEPLRRQIPNGMLVYIPNDYSFDVEPRPIGSGRTLLVDDLQLELDEIGQVISIWGLCPHTRWKSAALTPPKADFGEVFFIRHTALAQGMAIRIMKTHLGGLFSSTPSPAGFAWGWKTWRRWTRHP